MDNFEEVIKNYLKEHLRVYVDCNSMTKRVYVKLEIDGEEINKDYFDIDG